ncbi:MAG: dockerin type I repeat-containing protein, partial [Eubacteriales bacterium]|nr:dockerin type I repeat-containing protein [Eubacteriales bacterium]
PSESTEPSARPTDPEDITYSYLLGDADMDGKVNIKDATLIQKHSAGIENITDRIAKLACDADQNSAINVKDATAIQKYVANISVSTPIGEKFTTK